MHTRDINVRDVIEKACMEIQDSIKEKFHTFICIGKNVNSFYNINQSYESTEKLAEEFFFKGYGSISTYEGDKTEDFIFDDTLLNDFSTFLKDEDKDGAINLISDLTKSIKPFYSTPVYKIKNIYLKLWLLFINYASARFPNLYSKKADNFIFNMISQIDMLDEIEAQIINELEVFYEHIEKENTNKIVAEIKDVIDKNYYKPDLSIISISNELHVSRAHLCSVFKRNTGKTINKYITDYRIEKAVEILKESDTKLYEVAISVGFTDQNYFTKIFKKKFKMTPSEYRRKYSLCNHHSSFFQI